MKKSKLFLALVLTFTLLAAGCGTDLYSSTAAKESKTKVETVAPTVKRTQAVQATVSKETKPTEPITEAETEAPTPAISMGQQNALKSAKSYLSHSAFSYNGLIGQLEYEKYSHEEAVYAVDNCGADWNEQALKSAKSYLSHSAFSYKGLVGQLEYEEFTNEQAVYAVDNCGADWNEQAVKSAKSYLSHSSFSREGLIGQLEYEGFTPEQAAYGAAQNGY